MELKEKLLKYCTEYNIQNKILNLDSDTSIRNFIYDRIEQGVINPKEILKNYDMFHHEQQMYMKIRAEYLVIIILNNHNINISENEVLN